MDLSDSIAAMPHFPLDTAPYSASRARYVWQSNRFLGIEPLIASGCILMLAPLAEQLGSPDVWLRSLLVVFFGVVALRAIYLWSCGFDCDADLLNVMRQQKQLPPIPLLVDCKWALLGLPCLILAAKLI